MAIKPILFNAEMVRAILDGRKTCTRRVVKTRRKDACGFYVTKRSDGSFAGIYEYDEDERMFENQLIPPYQLGDILYAREAYSELSFGYVYKADGENIDHLGNVIKWHPSIHMPKEAARIWLKVTDVRVEHLQDIDGKDVLNEGLNCHVHPKAAYFDCNQREMFEKFWNSTIKKSDRDRYGWEANPYVFVIEFSKIDKPEEV